MDARANCSSPGSAKPGPDPARPNNLKRCRKPDGYAGAFPDDAPDVERSPVPLDDMLDDGEAEASASGFAAAGIVGAVEALGQAGEMLAGDSGAMVGHRQG